MACSGTALLYFTSPPFTSDFLPLFTYVPTSLFVTLSDYVLLTALLLSSSVSFFSYYSVSSLQLTPWASDWYRVQLFDRCTKDGAVIHCVADITGNRTAMDCDVSNTWHFNKNETCMTNFGWIFRLSLSVPPGSTHICRQGNKYVTVLCSTPKHLLINLLRFGMELYRNIYTYFCNLTYDLFLSLQPEFHNFDTSRRFSLISRWVSSIELLNSSICSLFTPPVIYLLLNL
jgi:hypothetical protein